MWLGSGGATSTTRTARGPDSSLICTARTAALAAAQIVLVLLALAADLHGDVHDDHVHDHANPEERGEQADVLAEGCVCCEKHLPDLRVVGLARGDSNASLPADRAPVS
jgi:hypothetical protein